MSLSDKALLEQFETLTLSPDDLSHVSHLRIAWLYLNKMSLKDAVEKIATGTKMYAESLGVYDKYHRTITEAIARIMHKRMSELQNVNFEKFLQGNRDLVDDLKSLLQCHYSEEILESVDARTIYFEPDKKEF
jgi:hypothetical protein